MPVNNMAQKHRLTGAHALAVCIEKGGIASIHFMRRQTSTQITATKACITTNNIFKSPSIK